MRGGGWVIWLLWSRGDFPPPFKNKLHLSCQPCGPHSELCRVTTTGSLIRGKRRDTQTTLKATREFTFVSNSSAVATTWCLQQTADELPLHKNLEWSAQTLLYIHENIHEGRSDLGESTMSTFNPHSEALALVEGPATGM